MGKFKCIIQKIAENLPDAQWVSPDELGQGVDIRQGQGKSLGPGQSLVGVLHLLQHQPQVEIDALQLHAAAVQLGKVQNIIDEPQKILGALLGILQVLLQLLRRRVPESQLQHTQHAVDRRADLMAHIAEEAHLRAPRLLRRVLGRLQLFLVAAPGGLIDDGQDDLLGFPHPHLGDENLQPQGFLCPFRAHDELKFTGIGIVRNGRLNIDARRALLAGSGHPAATVQAALADKGFAELQPQHVIAGGIHDFQGSLIDIDNGALPIQQAEAHIALVFLHLHFQRPEVGHVAHNHDATYYTALAAAHGRTGHGQVNGPLGAQHTDIARQSHGPARVHGLQHRIVIGQAGAHIQEGAAHMEGQPRLWHLRPFQNFLGRLIAVDNACLGIGQDDAISQLPQKSLP